MKANAVSVSPQQRLDVLRQLDRDHAWFALTDKRLCLGCGRIISGSDVAIYRGFGGLGPLRVRCPSKRCNSGPLEWVLPTRSGASEIARQQKPMQHGSALL